MTLYHFAAKRFVDSIRRHGLNTGFVLLSERPVRMASRYRWLTTNPDWQQEWAEGSGRLPYRRDECRLTIEIPDAHARNVLTWTISGPIISRAYDLLSGFGDPENWRLYDGDIRPEWIVAVDDNPRITRAA